MHKDYYNSRGFDHRYWAIELPSDDCIRLYKSVVHFSKQHQISKYSSSCKQTFYSLSVIHCTKMMGTNHQGTQWLIHFSVSPRREDGWPWCRQKARNPLTPSFYLLPEQVITKSKSWNRYSWEWSWWRQWWIRRQWKRERKDNNNRWMTDHTKIEEVMNKKNLKKTQRKYQLLCGTFINPQNVNQWGGSAESKKEIPKDNPSFIKEHLRQTKAVATGPNGNDQHLYMLCENIWGRLRREWKTWM